MPGGQASHTSMIENFFGFPDGIGGAELCRLAGRQAERFGAELVMLRGVEGSGRRGPDGPFTAAAARRLRDRGADRARRPGHDLAPARRRGRRGAARPRRLLRRRAQRGDAVRRPAGGRGRRRQLRGPGRDAPRQRGRARDDGRARRPAREVDVGLPRRPHRRPSADRRPPAHAGRGRRRGRTASSRACASATPAGAPRRCRRRRSSSASGARRARPGRPTPACASTRPASSSPAPTCSRPGGGPTDWPLARDPLALETSVPGLFAAGDVRHGSTKRVGGAVGEGAMAVGLAHRRLDELFETDSPVRA